MIYTTTAFGKTYDSLTEEELRNGKLDRLGITICNQAGTGQINITYDEIEDYKECEHGDFEVCDELPQTSFDALVNWLKEENLLEKQ
jgi:hypothetical protein